jgi:membrane associated rhomboid family serine protease
MWFIRHDQNLRTQPPSDKTKAKCYWVPMAKSWQRTWRSWSEAFETSSVLVGLMILITFLDAVLPIDLRVFGIRPRTTLGLIGIAFAPLLHANFAHLFANAVPLLVLLFLLFAQPRYSPQRTLAWLWMGSGVGTWLIGRGDAIHIGASSLIYGLVVYLIATGWWLRNWRSILVSVVVVILYGGIFFGVLPHRGIVSWEGHLAGAVTGLVVAWSQHA